MHFLSMKGEAALLSSRTGLGSAICERWMRANGIRGIPDLRTRYPDKRHADAMAAARDEIEAFALA